MDSLQIMVILLMEERRITRRAELRRLRDGADPFAMEKIIFRQHFRIPRSLASYLISRLEENNSDASDSGIPFEFRVLSTLNFLSHGSYQKSIGLSYLCPMSQSSVSRNIAYVCRLIASKMASNIKFCLNQDEKNHVKEGFYTKFGIKGVVGAIDGTHIGIVSPMIHDRIRPARLYMNRKGFYSINVKAIADSNRKFLSVNAKYPGSVHDSGIWSTTSARIHLIQRHDRSRYNWLIGDSGYPLEPWLLTPFSEPQNEIEEKFNKMQKRARNTVERAFGVLKNRFRCLHKNRTLHYTLKKAANIIYSCAILHNMLIDCGYADDSDDDDIINEQEEHDSSDFFESTYMTEGRRVRDEYVNTL